MPSLVGSEMCIRDRLESPYQSTILHVAGSNGKGTLCATLAVHLNHLGKSTVMFTSPHLVRVEERIRINGQPIDAHTLINAYCKYKR